MNGVNIMTVFHQGYRIAPLLIFQKLGTIQDNINLQVEVIKGDFVLSWVKNNPAKLLQILNKN